MPSEDVAKSVAADVLMAEDRAQTVDLDGSRPPTGVPSMGAPPRQAASRFAVSAGPAPAPPSTTEISTLEDLYSAYPFIGQGDWKLRVERLYPKTFDGVPCAGAIRDLSKRVSMDEFMRTFGGGSYLLHVLAPIDDTGLGVTGYRSKYKLKVQVPGVPNPRAAEEGQMNRGVATSSVVPEIETKRMELDFERERLVRSDRREYEQKLMEAQRPPAEAIEQLKSASEMFYQNLQATGRAQAEMMGKEMDALRSQLSARELELESMRSKLIAAETKAATNLHVGETDKLREVRAEYDRELAKRDREHDQATTERKERHEKELQDVKERYQQQIDSERKQAQDKLDTIRTTFDAEKSRVSDDASRRIESLEKSHANEVERLRENYEHRIDDLKQSADTERRSLEHRLSAEVASIKESATTRSQAANDKAELQTRMVESELRRLQDENRILRERNETLRDKLQKDPIEALTEARDLAAKTGMIDASESPSEAEPTWVAITKLALENFPKVVGPILEARTAAQRPMMPGPHPQQVQQQMMRQQMAQQQMMQQRQLAPMPQQQVERRYAPLPAPGYVPRSQMSQQQSAMPLGSAPAIQIPGSGSAIPLGSMAPMAPPPAAPAYVAQPQAQQPTAPHPTQAVPTQVPAPTPSTAGIPAPTPSSSGMVPPEAGPQIFQFVQAFEAAMNDGVPPQVFAKQFVAGVGQELAKQLADSYSNMEIVEFLSGQDPMGAGALQTRAGKKYLTQALDEARKLVR